LVLSKIYLFFSCFLLSYAGHSQFGPQTCLTKNFGSMEMATVADLDGDGFPDLLHPEKNGGVVDVAWHKNFGDGNYGPEISITINAASARCATAADLDNDGDLDILSASNDDNKIAWYKNLGLGNFSAELVISIQAQQARWVTTGDMDNDGDLDVISASWQDNKIAWYKNLGAGVFGPQLIVSTTALGAEQVEVADVDGDGDKDLISASSTDNKIAWYQNVGAGVFSAATVITSLADGGNDGMTIYVVDLDADFDVDILSASSLDDKVAWYENQGGGLFGSQNILSSLADNAESVYAIDVDGDFDLDVLSASSYDDEITCFENLGGSTFSTGQQLAILNGAGHICGADLNANESIDLIACGGSNLVVYDNIGLLSYQSNFITPGANSAREVKTVDLDNDGDRDILTASSVMTRLPGMRILEMEILERKKLFQPLLILQCQFITVILMVMVIRMW
jgi:hypothetical protein